MALVSQTVYAKHRGVSQAAVWKRTTAAGGPIPTHGPKKLIDVAEADALWDRTMSPQGAAPRALGKPRAQAQLGAAGRRLALARAAALELEVQSRRLMLEQRRGALIGREGARAKAFAYSRVIRDAWLAWPARIGPELAADLGLDATRVMIALEPYVHRQLQELADARLDLGPAVRR